MCGEILWVHILITLSVFVCYITLLQTCLVLALHHYANASLSPEWVRDLGALLVELLCPTRGRTHNLASEWDQLKEDSKDNPWDEWDKAAAPMLYRSYQAFAAQAAAWPGGRPADASGVGDVGGRAALSRRAGHNPELPELWAEMATDTALAAQKGRPTDQDGLLKLLRFEKLFFDLDSERRGKVAKQALARALSYMAFDLPYHTCLRITESGMADDDGDECVSRAEFMELCLRHMYAFPTARLPSFTRACRVYSSMRMRQAGPHVMAACTRRYHYDLNVIDRAAENFAAAQAIRDEHSALFWRACARTVDEWSRVVVPTIYTFWLVISFNVTISDGYQDGVTMWSGWNYPVLETTPSQRANLITIGTLCLVVFLTWLFTKICATALTKRVRARRKAAAEEELAATPPDVHMPPTPTPTLAPPAYYPQYNAPPPPHSMHHVPPPPAPPPGPPLPPPGPSPPHMMNVRRGDATVAPAPPSLYSPARPTVPAPLPPLAYPPRWPPPALPAPNGGTGGLNYYPRTGPPIPMSDAAAAAARALDAQAAGR